MSDLVERAGRAMFESDKQECLRNGGTDEKYVWNEEMKDWYSRRARAAIAVLREPTVAMLLAACAKSREEQCRRKMGEEPVAREARAKVCGYSGYHVGHGFRHRKDY